MSEYHHVFIHPGSPRPQLVHDIAAACDLDLKPTDAEFIDYSADLGHTAVELEFTHDYENDHGIPFERYDSLITVRDFDSDLQRQEETARRLFEQLTSLGRYDLMLVRDMQALLAQSGPPAPPRR
ncbi:hypothetical protein ACWD1Z_01815 [Streptomyces sp. NPDC002784]